MLSAPCGAERSGTDQGQDCEQHNREGFSNLRSKSQPRSRPKRLKVNGECSTRLAQHEASINTFGLRGRGCQRAVQVVS